VESILYSVSCCNLDSSAAAAVECDEKKNESNNEKDEGGLAFRFIPVCAVMEQSQVITPLLEEKSQVR
jgi:hypothetical protein